MNENIYYDINKMLSYNALLSFVIGERGVGKSYGAKKYVAKRFIKKGKQFAYVRRYKTELKEALIKKGEHIFWKQIQKDKEVNNYKFDNDKELLYINEKIAGYAIPLSISNILKSSTYDNVDTIIFDEFIIDNGNYHYLADEVVKILELIETLGRLRDIRVIFLGNAISITNPYFEYFNITIPYNSEIKIIKRDKNGNPLILINYIKNLKYREVKKESRFGQLIEGTKYGEYAIDNNFLRDSKFFIRKKTKLAKFYFILKLGGKNLGIWCDYKEGLMFISKDYDPNCPIIFSIKYEDHDERTLLVRGRTSPWFKSIIEHYRMASLCFENQQIKNNVMNVLVKFLTY